MDMRGGYNQLDSEEAAHPGPSGFRHGSAGIASSSFLTLDSFFSDDEGCINEIDEGPGRGQPVMQLVDNYEEEHVGITFTAQERLPRLPIPDLEETANKLLHILEPLQTTPTQRLDTEQQVLQFLKGDGPILQTLLHEYEQSGIEQGIVGSYIEEFWNESNMVPANGDDDTLPPTASSNLKNPFILLEDSPDPEIARHQIRRAASLTLAAMKVASAIRGETFLPDTFKERPLCMDQYKAVFGAARVPLLQGGDDIDVYPNTTHVVVMCRNQLYYFQAMWPDTGVLAVDEVDLYDILAAIDRDSRQIDETVAAQTCPGVLTTLPRREWAKIRSQMVQCGNERNAQYLTIVDSALFVLVLDDAVSPNSIDEKASNMFHGIFNYDHEECHQDDAGESSDSDSFADHSRPLRPSTTPRPFGSGCNRWYDKLQIIVCADGTAGVNFEHSVIDSHTAVRIVSDIYAETVVQFLQYITKTLPAHGNIPHIVDAPIQRAGKNLNCTESNDHPFLDVLPKKITLEIPDVVRRNIYHAGTALGDQIMASDTKVLVFREYGEKMIIANNLSSDSFVQMSIMLAYYQLYGKMVNVYEPVLTKMFYHGRTEAMRSAIVPAKDLCEIFFDAKVEPQAKLDALKRATLVHRRLVEECSAGRGVDRHLYALKCMAERNGLPVPEFFESEPWHMLNQSTILAVNCGNPAVRLFGISPLVPDGYGIGYIIKDYSIHCCLTSQPRQTSRFVEALESVLKALMDLLQNNCMNATNRARGNILNDTIEKVPEGKSSRSSANGDAPGIYDMWGLRPPDEEVEPSINTVHLEAITAPDPSPQNGCRWDHGDAFDTGLAPYHGQQGAGHKHQIMVPLQPLSDDEACSSREDMGCLPRQPRRAPRRGRKSAPYGLMSGGSEHSARSDVVPAVPQRRSSMFTGMSRRRSMTMQELNESGTSLLDSLTFDLSERSDPYSAGVQYH